MRVKEQTAISELVARKIGTEARMFKLGAITDESLNEKLRVTIIAAGFDGTSPVDLGSSAKKDTTAGTTTAEQPTDQLDGNEPGEGNIEDLVLVDDEGNETDTDPKGVSTKTGDMETSTSGYNDSPTIVRPEIPVFTGSDEGDTDTEVMELGNDNRPDDSGLIQSTIDKFVKGQYLPADLDRPTFERNRTILYSIPMFGEKEFVRSNLND